MAENNIKIKLNIVGLTKPSFIFMCFFIIKMFKIVVMSIHNPNPKTNEYACKMPEKATTQTIKVIPPKILFINDLTSKFNEFNMLDVMLESPKGIIIIDAPTKNSPLSVLSNKNSQIGTPRPIKTGTNNELIKTENSSPDLIRSFSISYLFCSKTEDNSGIKAKDNAPIIVDGKNKRGKVIPITAP